MEAEDLPSRGKLQQQHKIELRALKAEAKKAISKAKSKEDKAAAERKYAELEQQLLQRQQQQLNALAAAAAANSDLIEAQAAAAAATAAAEAAAQKLALCTSQATDAEKETLESLEALRLYGDGGDKKPSKAQRRREKKQQEMRDKERLFDQARAEANFGETESAQLAEALRKEGFRIFSVPGDGDCLFRAIVHQLKQTEGPEASWDVRILRGRIADVLLAERDLFKPFLHEELQNDQAYEGFCDSIRNSKDWGGEIELHAATRVLQRPIKVFSYHEDVTTINYGEEEYGEKPPLRLVYHRYLLTSGPHYNSVVPTTDDAAVLS